MFQRYFKKTFGSLLQCDQIVSLRSGDLTQEEVDKLRSEGRLDDLLKENTEEEGEVQGPKNRDEGV